MGNRERYNHEKREIYPTVAALRDGEPDFFIFCESWQSLQSIDPPYTGFLQNLTHRSFADIWPYVKELHLEFRSPVPFRALLSKGIKGYITNFM